MRHQLDTIHSVMVTVVIALKAQNVDHNSDFAVTLTRFALDPLAGVLIDDLGLYEDDDEDAP